MLLPQYAMYNFNVPILFSLYHFKVEENQGSIGHVWGGSDDTALNGISMVCSNDSNVHTSTVGPFGEWRSKSMKLYHRDLDLV